jgi:hypothetical protein
MPKSLLQTLVMACLTLTFASLACAGSIRPPDPDEQDLVPTGKGWGERPDPGAIGKAGKGPAKASKGSGINYHGGPLILGTTNVYYIWYGNWSGNAATTILADLAASIGGSPYYNINTTYYDGNNVHVTNSVKSKGSASGPASYKTSLKDADVLAAVSNAISSNALPKDANGVYFVLTSADVNETSGFCTQYCGWHSHSSIAGTEIKFAFVGNPDRCPSACEAQYTGPNGNAGADGMASIVAHELEEAVTDPVFNAWYDARGYENADKCAWTFGTTYKAANGALANMKLGTRDYLIQQNWVNTGSGKCAKSY